MGWVEVVTAHSPMFSSHLHSSQSSVEVLSSSHPLCKPVMLLLHQMQWARRATGVPPLSQPTTSAPIWPPPFAPLWLVQKNPYQWKNPFPLCLPPFYPLPWAEKKLSRPLLHCQEKPPPLITLSPQPCLLEPPLLPPHLLLPSQDACFWDCPWGLVAWHGSGKEKTYTRTHTLHR